MRLRVATALAFEAMAGFDPRDPDSATVESDHVDAGICASRFRLRWHSIHPLMAARRDRGSVDATAACGTSCPLRHRLPQGSGAIRFGRGQADRTRSFLAGCRSSCGAWRKLCYQRRFRSILCEFDLLLAPTVPCVAWPPGTTWPKNDRREGSESPSSCRLHTFRKSRTTSSETSVASE
jgi:hypothetical protein